MIAWIIQIYTYLYHIYGIVCWIPWSSFQLILLVMGRLAADPGWFAVCKHASNVSFARKCLGYTGAVHPGWGVKTHFRFGWPSIQKWKFPEIGAPLNHLFKWDFPLWTIQLLGIPYLWKPAKDERSGLENIGISRARITGTTVTIMMIQRCGFQRSSWLKCGRSLNKNRRWI